MRDAIEEIIEFTTDKTKEDLKKNRMLALSLVQLLEITGEAAGRISKELREKYHHVPWNAIIGMRNRLIHGYFDIDLDVIWKTVSVDIPKLKEELKIIISKEEKHGEPRGT